MNFRRIMAGLILMGLGATPALAQKSLGDLLDGGAKKLSKEAVQSAISGAQISGTSTTGAATDYHYTADGKFSGNLRNSEGWTTGTVGTWRVDDSGRLCAEWILTKNSKRFNGCGFLYVKADQYYYVESDSDKGAPIYKYVIKK